MKAAGEMGSRMLGYNNSKWKAPDDVAVYMKGMERNRIK